MAKCEHRINHERDIDRLLRRLGLYDLKDPSEIDLSLKRITSHEATLLCEVLKSVKSVRVLKLCYNELGDVGCEALASAINLHSSLTTLDLGFNNIGDDGAKSLAKGLHMNDALETLYLSGNNIGKSGMKALSEALKYPHSSQSGLRTLHLTGNRIGPEGSVFLASALKVNKTLSRLYVGGGEIHAQGACEIGSVLSSNLSLRHLHLSANKIGDQGLIGLSQGLQENRKINTLELGFNYLSPVGIEYLKNSLWGYSDLRHLLLDNNNIGCIGAKSIASILPTLSLRALNLSFNGINSPGIQEIMAAVLQCPNLTQLALSGNNVDTDAAQAIGNTVANPNCGLVSLSLEHTGIGQVGQKRIASGFLRNQKLKCKHFIGFNLGIVLVSLGMSQQLCSLTNELALDHIRSSWEVHLALLVPGNGGNFSARNENRANTSAPSHSAMNPQRTSSNPSINAKPLNSSPSTKGAEIKVTQNDRSMIGGASSEEGFNIGAIKPNSSQFPSQQGHHHRRRNSHMKGTSRGGGIGSQAILGHGATFHHTVPLWASEEQTNHLITRQNLLGKLNHIASQPFQQAELWELQQYFFSPPPHPEIYQRQEEEPLWGREKEGRSREAVIPRKRPANHLTCTRIAYLPRLKARIESLRGRDDPKVLTLLRQLKYLRDIDRGKHNDEFNSFHGNGLDIEAILLDLI
mmetsp:Transcript_7758/g.11713  ORF Transcript_7758/g.11713 Transcript_7758/m.11713 type:complete len:689 (-) Transcript_7758:126-2192(-)